MSLGAALATAKLLEDAELGGKVVLFGTPAEGRSYKFCLERHTYARPFNTLEPYTAKDHYGS